MMSARLKKVITGLSFVSLLISIFFISPSSVEAKGGSFNIETVTTNSFGNPEVFGFNDGLQFGSYFYVTTDTFGGTGVIYRSDSGDPGDWSLAATAGFGDSDNYALDAMIEFESNLYVTTANATEGAEMWRSANGTSWTPVVGGGATVGNGFGDGENVIIKDTAVFDDTGLGDQFLWAFTQNALTGSEFWRSTDGTTWTQTTAPSFTSPTEVYIGQTFSFASRLYVFVLDNNDAEELADDIEVWYTTGGATPAWTLLNTVSFQNVTNGAAYLWFLEHGGNLYVGNAHNTSAGIWVTADGDVFTLSHQFTEGVYVYPISSSKGLFAGVGDVSGIVTRQLSFIGGVAVEIFRYSGGNWIDTGISIPEETMPFFQGAKEFGDYYYAWGGIPGAIQRVDLRPCISTPDASQTQLGDGVVYITFTVGDITDSDTLRAKIEYDIGGGYQDPTLSEEAGDISATYGTPDVENDNEYQVGNASSWITTSTGANTITVKWLSKIDEPTANTTNASIRVSISDGATSGAQKTDVPATVDNIDPELTSVNLVDGQVVTTNPYILRVKATDSASGIWRVEFYVDDNLICTDSVVDANGDYTCNWDTSQYHSSVFVRVFDMVGNMVQGGVYYIPVELPPTGFFVRSSQYAGVMLNLLSAVIFIGTFLPRKKYSISFSPAN